jgi:phosphoserine phosphatase RsbU/P
MRKLAILLIAISATCGLHAQSSAPGIFAISPQQCVWHAGDDPAWAAPSLDESGWQPLTQWEAHSYQPRIWARCHIDPAAFRNFDHPAMQVRLLAAYEVFLNGVPIGRNGDLKNGLFSMDSIRIFPFPPSLAANRSNVLSLRMVFRMVSVAPESSMQAPKFLLGGRDGLRDNRAGVLVEQFSDGATSFLPMVVIGIVGLVLLGFSAWDRTHLEPILLGLSCAFVGLMFVNVLCGTLMTREPVWAQLVLYSFSGTANLLAQTFFFFALARKRVPAMFGLLIGAWFMCAAWPLAELLLRPQEALRLDAIHFSVIAPVSYVLLAILLGSGPFIAFWPYQQIPHRMRAIAGLSAAWGAVLIVFFLALAAEPFQGMSGLFQAWQSTLFPAQSIAQLCMVGAIIAFILRDQRQIAVQRASLAGEMQAGREVQRHLVPLSMPSIPGFRCQAAYLPAAEVGGDFYQLFPRTDDSVLIVVGDVSGKGLKAAMTGTLVLGALRNMAQTSLSPSQILSRLNFQLANSSDGGFVTGLCAHISTDGILTLANAGHLPPYRNGEEAKIESSLPLGITADTTYAESTLQLNPGDTLTFLSDGVVEAQGPKGELFGFDRTRAISRQSAEQIAAAAQAFGQQDDITVLTLQYAPAEVAHA